MKGEPRTVFRLRTGGRLLSIETSAGVHPPDGYARFEVRRMEVRPGDAVLDLGCGSGLFGLSAACRGAARVVLADIDPRAVRCATANARRNGLGSVKGRCGDLFAPCRRERFDAIVANLPQTPAPRRILLSRWGGRDGARHLGRFLRAAARHLRPGGRVYFALTGLVDREAIRRAVAGRFRLRSLLRIERAITPGEYERLLPGLFDYLERRRRSEKTRFNGRGGRYRLEVRFMEGRPIGPP